MSQTKTTAMNYQAILRKAKSGEYKLPAFQRKWKWTTRQVMSLYESLRLGYPIGAFLFLSSPEAEKLGPRAFHGAGKKASGQPVNESLVLDGQQRITAGMSLYYGLEGVDGNEFYINCFKVDKLLQELKVNLDDQDQVLRFCEGLDLEDGYLVARPRRNDRRDNFRAKGLLWTSYLTEERQTELDDILDDLSEKRMRDVIRKVVRQHLRPNTNVQVPVIELGSEFDLAAISKVFSTINSTGKLLTSFELVVAILYPNDIRLEDDVEDFKSKYPYYANMDKNGEVLLQVVAILSGHSPKKADLPKTIDAPGYRANADKAARLLNEAGSFLSADLGVGLDVTDKLTPYDAIFAPLSLVLSRIQDKGYDNAKMGAAKRKLRTWFVASAITQRYQEGVHNKQQKDLEEVFNWIEGGNVPDWIEAARATPSIKFASAKGAIGKLLLCLANAKKPSDPIQGGLIGYRDGASASQIHHIFPTRWGPKGVSDYQKDRMDTSIALNTMILSSETNADWLNFDPKNQVEQSEKALGAAHVSVFDAQMIDAACLEVMKRNDKRMADYDAFVEARYRAVVERLREYDITESDATAELLELDEPSILDD